MTIVRKLGALIPNERILSALGLLEETYAELEREQGAWMEASPFRCPSGCGACCEGFVPDVWEIEAFYMAAQLLIEGREVDFLEEGQGARYSGSPKEERRTGIGYSSPLAEGEGPSCPCPFFRPEGLYHCSVYISRPLVCRVFGFSGDRDKGGRLRFTPCKRMEGWNLGPSNLTSEEYRRRSWSETELRERFSALPPDMSRYARRVEAIEPPWAGTRDDLPSAVRRALEKLLFYRGYGSPPKAA